MNKIYVSIFLLGALVISACESGPRVIESESATEPAAENAAGQFSFQDAPTAQSGSSEQTHQVQVLETLNTERYTYMRVKEDANEFWVAISKREVKVGETYVFQGGLLKKNFYSQEFNRQFETLYLVSNFGKPNAGGEAELDAGLAQMEAPDLKVSNIKHAPGAVLLSDLFANKAKYANKEILVTGKCVKVNPMIMNRNWIHIQDGTGDKLDLTITTTENIPLGATLTLKGIIALDKDFGAGYRYDIIMEGAVSQ